MEERKTNDVAIEILSYWKEILRIAGIKDPVLEYHVWNVETSIFNNIIKSFSTEELSKALTSENETVKFYYMRRIICRYVDVMEGHSLIVNDDYVQLTEESCISELDITSQTYNALYSMKARMLGDLPEFIESGNLSYSQLLDVSAALSILKYRRTIC
jgi:predicted DNA-binding protein